VHILPVCVVLTILELCSWWIESLLLPFLCALMGCCVLWATSSLRALLGERCCCCC
jgi:hypothetical protein